MACKLFNNNYYLNNLQAMLNLCFSTVVFKTVVMYEGGNCFPPPPDKLCCTPMRHIVVSSLLPSPGINEAALLAMALKVVQEAFWSIVWQSPLQQISDIRMQDLKKETVDDGSLGHGSFGDVMLLTDMQKKTMYVGRRLPEDGLTDKATRNRVLDSFAAITRQLCSVHHPNIVQMHGVFFHDSASYLPMLVYEKAVEWTLECYLLENRREVDKVTILQHVARGLEYLHDQKPPILHLNLTVVNVFISQIDPRSVPVAKIADAGLTNLIAAGITTTRVKPRIIDYLSEEEKEKEWDTKVDVLCYGVLMGHVIVQETIVETLPLCFGDSIADVESVTSTYLHERLKVHPLYNLLLQCLTRNNRSRLTAFDIRRQIDTHVSH